MLLFPSTVCAILILHVNSNCYMQAAYQIDGVKCSSINTGNSVIYKINFLLQLLMSAL